MRPAAKLKISINGTKLDVAQAAAFRDVIAFAMDELSGHLLESELATDRMMVMCNRLYELLEGVDEGALKNWKALKPPPPLESTCA